MIFFLEETQVYGSKIAQQKSQLHQLRIGCEYAVARVVQLRKKLRKRSTELPWKSHLLLPFVVPSVASVVPPCCDAVA